MDFFKVQVPLYVADFGISSQALAFPEYSTMEEKGTVKFGADAEVEDKFKGSHEKAYDKDGNAEFEWSPLRWKTSRQWALSFK